MAPLREVSRPIGRGLKPVDTCFGSWAWNRDRRYSIVPRRAHARPPPTFSSLPPGVFHSRRGESTEPAGTRRVGPGPGCNGGGGDPAGGGGGGGGRRCCGARRAPTARSWGK